jgi:hypothetical protein
MADIKFHGDVIFCSVCIVVVVVVVVVAAKVSYECSAPWTHVENTNFRGICARQKVCSQTEKFRPCAQLQKSP